MEQIGTNMESMKNQDEKKNFMTINHLEKVAETEKKDNQMVSSNQNNNREREEV